MSTSMVVLVGSNRRAFGKMKATLDNIVVIVTTLFFMEWTFVVSMMESRAVFALVTMTSVRSEGWEKLTLNRCNFSHFLSIITPVKVEFFTLKVNNYTNLKCNIQP